MAIEASRSTALPAPQLSQPCLRWLRQCHAQCTVPLRKLALAQPRAGRDSPSCQLCPSSVPACRLASRQAAALGIAPRIPRSCSEWGSQLGGFGWSPSSQSTAAGAHTGAGRTAAGHRAQVSTGGSCWEASPALPFPSPRQWPREAKATQQRSKGGTEPNLQFKPTQQQEMRPSHR